MLKGGTLDILNILNLEITIEAASAILVGFWEVFSAYLSCCTVYKIKLNLQYSTRPLFLVPADGPYIHSYFHLSTMATSPQWQ